jgi:type II secretory pathway predicted ATPase ExeA
MRQKDILSYYQLESHPFNKEIPAGDLVCLEHLEQVYESIMLLIETRGIGILTGPSGSGKSSLLRRVSHQLNPGLYQAYYICYTSLGTTEFYQTMAAALGLSTNGRKAAVFRRIKEFIASNNQQKKIHPVIFIDEAHALSSDTLKELRMLLNFEYDSKNACTLVLCGHSELRQKLSLNIYASLTNSITYSIAVDALPAEQTYHFLESRIQAAGGAPGLVTKSAMKLIHDASGGIIRTAGSLCWQAIIQAYRMKSQNVEKEHIQMVIAP